MDNGPIVLIQRSVWHETAFNVVKEGIWNTNFLAIFSLSLN